MDQEQESSERKREEMNAILDAALDELVDDETGENTTAAAKTTPPPTTQPHEDKKKPPSQPKPVFGPELPPNFDIGSFDDVMSKMFEGGDGSDPEAALDSFMQQLQSQLVSEMNKMDSSSSSSNRQQGDSSTAKSDADAKEASAAAAAQPSSNETNVDRTISKLLNDMATANNVGGENDIGTEEEDAIFKDMMKEFEKMGNGGGSGFDQDAIVDGMMQQLLSKEIMYEPMKQVTERFPSWLEENKDTLPEEEYKR